MPNRIQCSAPGCRRTCKQNPVEPYREWMCGPHWRVADKRLRKRVTKLRRRAKRNPNWWRPFNIAWDRCKRQAIERILMGLDI